MHKIDKTERIGTVQLRNTLLNVNSLDIKNFAQAVSASYHKRSSKEFAKFKTSPQPIYETLPNNYTEVAHVLSYAREYFYSMLIRSGYPRLTLPLVKTLVDEGGRGSCRKGISKAF